MCVERRGLPVHRGLPGPVPVRRPDADRGRGARAGGGRGVRAANAAPPGLPLAPPRRRAGRGRGLGRALGPREARGPARRRPRRDQGRAAPAGLSHDRRDLLPRSGPGPRGRHRRGPAARGGSPPPRQGEHARDRPRGDGHQPPPRGVPEPLRPRPDHRGLLQRLRGGRRGRLHAGRHRGRWRRIGPDPVRPVRPGGLEGDLRSHLRARRGPPLLERGPHRSHGGNGRGCGRGLRAHRGRGPEGPEHPRATSGVDRGLGDGLGRGPPDRDLPRLLRPGRSRRPGRLRRGGRPARRPGREARRADDQGPRPRAVGPRHHDHRRDGRLPVRAPPDPPIGVRGRRPPRPSSRAAASRGSTTSGPSGLAPGSSGPSARPSGPATSSPHPPPAASRSGSLPTPRPPAR